MNSKRYLKAKELVSEDKDYSLSEAVDILKTMPKAKFNETVEISGQFPESLKTVEGALRGSVVLPHGTGKEIKILVFCESEKEKEAKEAGADYIGSDEIINKILNENWIDFDCCISSPSMMRSVSKLGKFLGPRGLMPSPKTGTVTENISFAIKEAKRGKIDFRMDKFGCIHAGVGKISFDREKLIENIKAFIDALNTCLFQTGKGEFSKGLYLCTTMSPSLKIAL